MPQSTNHQTNLALTTSRCSLLRNMTLVKSGHLMAKAAFHTLDFLRIALVTQSLASQWIHQLLVELGRFNWGPTFYAQMT